MKVTISKEFEEKLKSAVVEKVLSMSSIPAAEEICNKIANDLSNEIEAAASGLPFKMDVQVKAVKKAKSKDKTVRYICNIVWDDQFRESVAIRKPGKPKWGVSLPQIYNNGVDIPRSIKLPYHNEYGKITSHTPTARHRSYEGFIQDACSRILAKYGDSIEIQIRSFYTGDVPYFNQTSGSVNPSRMVRFKG